VIEWGSIHWICIVLSEVSRLKVQTERQRVVRIYSPDAVGRSASSGLPDELEASPMRRGMVRPGIAVQGLSGLRHGQAGMAEL